MTDQMIVYACQGKNTDEDQSPDESRSEESCADLERLH